MEQNREPRADSQRKALIYYGDDIALHVNWLSVWKIKNLNLPYTKINSRCIIESNEKGKTITLSEKNRRLYL